MVVVENGDVQRQGQLPWANDSFKQSGANCPIFTYVSSETATTKVSLGICQIDVESKAALAPSYNAWKMTHCLEYRQQQRKARAIENISPMLPIQCAFFLGGNLPQHRPFHTYVNNKEVKDKMGNETPEVSYVSEREQLPCRLFLCILSKRLKLFPGRFLLIFPILHQKKSAAFYVLSLSKTEKKLHELQIQSMSKRRFWRFYLLLNCARTCRPPRRGNLCFMSFLSSKRTLLLFHVLALIQAARCPIALSFDTRQMRRIQLSLNFTLLFLNSFFSNLKVF